MTPDLIAQARAAETRATARDKDGPLWPFDEIVAYVNTARRTLTPALDEVARLAAVVVELETKLALKDSEIAKLAKGNASNG